ncbi:hypothetical protein DPMN_177285 [Dreissena polymorpha]|uniref:Uncharacterized protein n=3 Tax=Dreissena polymorpha TaxID=45954 RepID=A0A9D4ECR3_DREPO|nr:hypothetical protein DPMN_177285 [Dreissena polymorpha]
MRRFEEQNHGKSPEILTNSSRLSVPVARSKDSLSSYPENNTIINVPEPSQILRHLRSPAQKLASPTSTIHHRAAMPSNKSKSSPSRPHSAGSRKVEILQEQKE